MINCRVRSQVWLIKAAPSCRASRAGTGSAKEIRMCAPFPEREIFGTAGMPSSPQDCRKAPASSRQSAFSKSAAGKQRLSSPKSG